MTCVAVGAAKSRCGDQHSNWSGLETRSVDSGAAAIAYILGVLSASHACRIDDSN